MIIKQTNREAHHQIKAVEKLNKYMTQQKLFQMIFPLVKDSTLKPKLFLMVSMQAYF